jgi:glycosyltransferase involved in cell wall biosynthesis
MAHECGVTVVLSTCNRAGMLRDAVSSLLAQPDSSRRYEVIVVDNNSTDHTRAVVDGFTGIGAAPLRYVFEPRQGLSYARNAGIAAARADIVAFTDDDVRVTPDWVRVIADTFAARPDVQCLGGRTLPLWPSPPPKWLTRRHWVGPLALQDYGDHSVVIDATRPLCLAGANVAFRKQIFDQIGLFSVDFPRAQDTELLLRLYRAGHRALYVPEMLVFAPVEPDRLTKAYHRRWHSNIGRCNARMRFEELADPVYGLRAQVPNVRRLGGVPVFAMRQLTREVCQWMLTTALGREADAFLHETRARALVSYMREARALAAPGATTGPSAAPRSSP